MTITDQVKGTGTRTVTRLFHTPLAVQMDGDGVTLHGDRRTFRLRIDGARPTLRPITRWTEYGKGGPATTIEARVRTALPWTATTTVEAI